MAIQINFNIHADAQIANYQEHGLDSTFISFKPSPATIHYRNPVIYRVMLDTVAEIVMESVIEQLIHAECFSIQVDGSVDKYSIDNKFITARYLDKNKNIKNVFPGENHSFKQQEYTGIQSLQTQVVIK